MPPTGRSTSGTSRPTGRATSSITSIRCGRIPTIDFVGIDNYMPLSDWRDGLSHADAAAGSIYDLEYLKRQRRRAARASTGTMPTRPGATAQDRLPISDGAYGEDWVFRYKDLVSWWSMPHVNRLGGVKAAAPTEWQPRSKPIWFTELGCPAVNKGTNQPNVFHDPKSSESFFPYHSNGSQDDFIQYPLSAGDVRALERSGEQSAVGPLLRAAWWTWPGRMSGPGTRGRGPISRTGWRPGSDGANHARGHWLNGRTSLAALAEVVAEICDRCDLTAIDVGRLHGGVTGYAIEAVESGRQSLQPLMLAYGFDSFAVDGALAFASRGGRGGVGDRAERCVVVAGAAGRLADASAARPRRPGASRSGSSAPTPDYQPGAVEALRARTRRSRRPSRSTLPIVLSDGEARAIAERALSEGRHRARQPAACACRRRGCD